MRQRQDARERQLDSACRLVLRPLPHAQRAPIKSSPGIIDGRKDQSRSSGAGAPVEATGGRAVAAPPVQGLDKSALREEQEPRVV